jgi:hypothetical protein
MRNATITRTSNSRNANKVLPDQRRMVEITRPRRMNQ